MYSQNDPESINGVRLVELSTGEISASSSFEKLLDEVFARPDAARERGERFLSEQATDRGRRAQDGTTLGKSAISGRKDKNEGKTVTCNVYADLVHVAQNAGRVGQEESEEREWIEDGEGGGKRGAITGYSHKSRVRFMNDLAKLRDVSDGFFMTLTFPDAVVAAWEEPGEFGRWAKEKVWTVMRHRLLRAFPDAGGWWRIEYQDRKSGDFLGEFVPHFHLLVVGLRGIKLDYVKRWLAVTWMEVVGIYGDADFFEHGSNAWRINNRRHAMAYVSKYAAKEARDEFRSGRRWGQFGKLDLSVAYQVEMTPLQLIEFKRYQRALLRSRSARGRGFAARMARIAPAFGGSVLGLGDLSMPGGWHGHEPTIFRMLKAVGVEIGKTNENGAGGARSDDDQEE